MSAFDTAKTLAAKALARARQDLPGHLDALRQKADALMAGPAAGPDIDARRAVYAIGDLHGCADLIGPMLEAIRADMARTEIRGAAFVFLGDYVDRGQDSARTVARIRGLQTAAPDGVIALMGNHERMMLDFLDRPDRAGPRWLRNGGAETLTSYGVARPKDDPASLAAAAKALAAAMPEGERAWLAALPNIWRSGDLICAHAGMDPALGPDDQTDENLLWGHDRFRRDWREDDLWVAHGHWIVRAPMAERGRVAVDTGAYETGRLTAARIGAGPTAFVTVRRPLAERLPAAGATLLARLHPGARDDPA